MNVRELSKELINRANSASFNGTRGDVSKSGYKNYANKILELPVSDDKKQELLDKLYKMWSKLLSYEAQHVSVAVAGGANYNAKKLDKGDKILELSTEISEWFKNIENQVETSTKRHSKVGMLIKQIIWGVKYGYSVTNDWKKLAELSKEDFKILYEELDEQYHFKKNTIAYKLYHNLDNITEKKKEVFYDNADYTAYIEGDRAYIRFTLKPKQQLIVALKNRGWWWNARENAWSTYLSKFDKEWVQSISARYTQYL